MSAAFTPGPWEAQENRTVTACGLPLLRCEWLEAALDEREQEHGSLPDGAPHWSVRARAVLAKVRGGQ